VDTGITGITELAVKSDLTNRLPCWQTIADNLKKAGWSLSYVSAVDSDGRTIWITDAHRGDGNRFVVRAHENLTAFLELERACSLFARFSLGRAGNRLQDAV
jgi:hypothetical protein